jgi:transketolase
VPHQEPVPLDDRSLRLRGLVVDALAAVGQGHIGPSLSAIEILRVLYDDVLRVDPASPGWPDRDRLIYSKGHGCLALYAVLADKGFFDTSLLRTVGTLGSPLGGHPERPAAPGVEFSTGALGHGLPVGVGVALGLRIRGRSSRVFVVTGDGELNEGSVWEAAMAAAHHRLDALTVVVDRNGVQSYAGTSEILELEPLADKWSSFGFETVTVDGHDLAALRSVLGRVPLAPGRPSAVICRTVKGRGLAFAEHDAAWHYRSGIDAEQVALMRAALAANDPALAANDPALAADDPALAADDSAMAVR